MSIRSNNFCFSSLTNMLKHHKVHLFWQGLRFSVIFYMNNNIYCALVCWGYAKSLICTISFNTIPILQMRKLRFRKVKQFSKVVQVVNGKIKI